MLSAYRVLFRVPGVAPFLIGASLARIGGAMFGVAVIVMVSTRQGSYGLAGSVSAVGLLVLAIAGPMIGRLIDKGGQRRIAVPFVLTSAIAGLATVGLSVTGAPVWTLFVAYGVSACIPEMGPLTRARWVHIFRDEPDNLHTALSFEQVADEGGFVIGPVLAVALATMWFPEAGLLGAVVLFAVGTLLFLSARATEPPVIAHEHRPHGFAIRTPGLLVLTGMLVMTGVIFGGNEVVAVAVADEAGQKSFSSVILALFAFGSMISGLLYGARKFRMGVLRRLALAAAGMSLLELPVLLTDHLWALAVIMFIAGSATAPTLITSLTLTQRLLPPAWLTEGMAVAVTGILVGISIGTSAAGWAVESLGPHEAYAVPVGAGVLAVVILVLGRKSLQRGLREADQREAGQQRDAGAGA